MKYAAAIVRKMIPMKNSCRDRIPELKIGEGGGCMTYWALERPIQSATAKSTLKSEVNIGLASRVSPT